MDSRIPAYHVNGCGDVAFYFLFEPYEGMDLLPSAVQYADGSQPPLDTMALCGSCYESLEVNDLEVRVGLAGSQ